MKERHEATLAKLNKVIESQLADMQGLKSINQSLEQRLSELEKEALLTAQSH